MQLLSILPLLLSPVAASAVSPRQNLAGSTICQQIAGNITGKVYYPLSSNYNSDIAHYFASSQESAMCSVEVASEQDISNVLKILGSTRTPFGVKSGGHSSNKGFSSTTGVQISLANFKQINLAADKKSVEVGLGNVWTEVYTALNGTGVNVAGGRVPGPGTGGFSLGGGYSWITNQYGLTCDTTISYNLVLPNGTHTVVDASKPDLFFALKGGLNRFGIVTSIVYKTFPMGNLVYAGSRYYPTSSMPALINATAKFQSENTDPKAQVLFTINSGLEGGAILIMFYDGPHAPAAFAPFNNISGLLSDNVKPQSFIDFENSIPVELTSGERGAYHTLMTTDLTPTFLRAIYNESQFYGALSLVDSATIISYDTEPFGKYGVHATDSAFPHSRSPLPLNLYFGWLLEANDAYWLGLIQQSIDHLTEVAKAEGIYDPESYPYVNYARSTYTGAQVYGPKNVARLRVIRDKYDPDLIMNLAGGFAY